VNLAGIDKTEKNIMCPGMFIARTTMGPVIVWQLAASCLHVIFLKISSDFGPVKQDEFSPTKIQAPSCQLISTQIHTQLDTDAVHEEPKKKKKHIYKDVQHNG
jgi:hypothetical protein